MTTKKLITFGSMEMVPWGEAKVHVMSHALHYGTSVFEGIRCYDSQGTGGVPSSRTYAASA
jgi:branched-chain amino acid aminotransferase